MGSLATRIGVKHTAFTAKVGRWSVMQGASSFCCAAVRSCVEAVAALVNGQKIHSSLRKNVNVSDVPIS